MLRLDSARYRYCGIQRIRRKGKVLVELRVRGPIMNLLRMVYSDNSGTGKVNHENFKLGKILQSMTDSPEFDFISRVRARYFHQYPIISLY